MPGFRVRQKLNFQLAPQGHSVALVNLPGVYSNLHPICHMNNNRQLSSDKLEMS